MQHATLLRSSDAITSAEYAQFLSIHCLHSHEANWCYAGTYQVYQQTPAVWYLVDSLLVLAHDQPSADSRCLLPARLPTEIDQLEITSEIQTRIAVRFACDLLLHCCDS